MADASSGPGWTQAQWDMVQSELTQAFEKASVAMALLPCYGPLNGSIETVRREELSSDTDPITVSDDATVTLITLAVRVELTNQQVADESLSSALLAFRRAANRLAQAEDALVFNGTAVAQPSTRATGRRQASLLANVVVTGGQTVDGLTALTRVAAGSPARAQGRRGAGGGAEDLVATVARAVAELEGDSHTGPFACVLGQSVFELAHTPNEGSLVLPADRIMGLLTGPGASSKGVLLRSGQMGRQTGIVTSMSSRDIDIVVGTPPKVQFLQVTQDARHLFRVYERFIVRIKDPAHPSVRVFTIAGGGSPPPGIPKGRTPARRQGARKTGGARKTTGMRNPPRGGAELTGT